MSFRDADGQPPKAFHYHRLVDRQITEMLGLAKGIICDGVLTDAEAMALRQWVRANPDACHAYPGKDLSLRVLTYLEDGVVDDDEREELKEFLMELVGEPDDLTGSMQEATRLPIDSPPPTLLFDNREYVFTGLLAAGSRDWAQRQVTERGGRFANAITKRTTYLVIGLIPSEAWIQSTHGRKIQEAVRLKQSGHPIHIVGEEHWLEAIQYDSC